MRAVPRRIPPGVIGGLGGALGALPLLSAARSQAARLASAAALPGAEKLAGDLKEATFAEAGVLLALLPLSALFFGALLPGWLGARAPAHRPSLEWAGAGFSIACPIWRCGAPARVALLVGAALAFLAEAFVLVCRRRPSIARSLRALSGEPFAPIFVAAAAWEIARRVTVGDEAAEAKVLSLAAVLAAIAFLLVPRAGSARSPAPP